MVVWHCPCKSRSPPGASSQTLVTKVTGVCSFPNPRRSRGGGLFFTPCAVGAACNRSQPGASSSNAFPCGKAFVFVRFALCALLDTKPSWLTPRGFFVWAFDNVGRCRTGHQNLTVIPAKAGIQRLRHARHHTTTGVLSIPCTVTGSPLSQG